MSISGLPIRENNARMNGLVLQLRRAAHARYRVWHVGFVVPKHIPVYSSWRNGTVDYLKFQMA